MGGYYYYDVPAEDVFAGVFGVAYMAIMLFSMALSLGVYIMTAIGQYKMSQKCGIDKPWLAFIPVANSYNLGKLAEKYYDGKPAVKRYSRILLGLNIATVVGSIVISVMGVVLGVMGTLLGFSGAASGNEDAALAGAGIFLVFLFFMMAYLTLVVVECVFTYIALYRVFRIFAPDNAVLFLVLSIFVNISYPIIMLVLASKEPVMMRRDYYVPYGAGGISF